MSKATEEALAELHGELAKKMKKMLAGDTPITASDLSVIRQFLKDNGITSDGENDEGLRSLSDDLPDELPENVSKMYGR